MNYELELAVQEILRKRLEEDEEQPDQARWSRRLEEVGARRLGRLMGMIVDRPQGCVRVVDPLVNGGSHGFVEMPEDVAERMVVLGLP